MKHWRRTSSSGGGSAAATVPRVVSVVTDNVGVTYTVTFDQAVTWDAFHTGTFDFPDGEGTWLNQLSPTSLQVISPSGNSSPGINWDWAAPDTSLSPIPDPTQTGVTS